MLEKDLEEAYEYQNAKISRDAYNTLKEGTFHELMAAVNNPDKFVVSCAICTDDFKQND